MIGMSDIGVVALFCGGAAFVWIINETVQIRRWRKAHDGAGLHLSARDHLKAAATGLLLATLGSMTVLWLMALTMHPSTAAAVRSSPADWVVSMLIGLAWYAASVLYYLLAPSRQEKKRQIGG